MSVPHPPSRLRRAGRRLAVSLLVLLVTAQLIRPRHPEGVLPSDGRMTEFVVVPSRVDTILRRACRDCHSDQTRWPWYSHVAPISWLIVHDVRHARADLDFSRWSIDPIREPTPEQQFRWMCQDARRGIMPPRLYRFMHREARLTADDVAALCAWAEEQRAVLEDPGSVPR